MTAGQDTQTTAGRMIAGRYRLRHPIGQGGMGTVWLAEDTLLRREVAVKALRFPTGVTDRERATLRERSLREARAAARLDSPHVVRIYDVVDEDGGPCVVMELLRGRTLAQIVREDGPLAPADAARIGAAVARALEIAHDAGVVHRDVKPGNVFVTQTGRVVLTDFGVATSAGDPSITETGLLVGSPAYISPERARGGEPTPASDVWSLGATLFTAVEGRPPFDGGDPLGTLTAVVSEPPRPHRNAGALAPTLDQMLTKDPAARPAGSDLADRLTALAGDPPGATPPVTAVLPGPGASPNGDRPAGGRTGDAVATGERTTVLRVGEAQHAEGRQAERQQAEGPPAGQQADRPPAVRQQAPRPPAVRQQAPRPPAVRQQAARPPADRQQAPRPPADRQQADHGGGADAYAIAGASEVAAAGSDGPSSASLPVVTARRPAGAPPGPPLDAPPDEGLERPDRRRATVAVLAVAAVVAAAIVVGLVGLPGSGGHRAASSGPSHSPAATGPAPAHGATTGPATGAAGSTSAPSGATTGATTGGTTGTGSTGTSGGTGGTGGSGSGTTGSPAAPATGIPAGWQTHTAAEGWSIAHPPGWSVSRHEVHGQQVVDMQDGTGTLVRVNVTPTPYEQPIDDWRHYEPQFAEQVSGYQRVALRALTVGGDPAADWEFLYTDGIGLHALDREVRSGDTVYAVLFQTHADDWDGAASTRDAVLGSFRPAG